MINESLVNILTRKTILCKCKRKCTHFRINLLLLNNMINKSVGIESFISREFGILSFKLWDFEIKLEFGMQFYNFRYFGNNVLF